MYILCIFLRSNMTVSPYEAHMKIDVTKTSKNLAAELARRQNNLAKLKGPSFCSMHFAPIFDLCSSRIEHRYPVSNNCVIYLKQKGWTLDATEVLSMT